MLEELEYEHEKQKKVEDLEKQKNKNLKSLENQNKILLDQQEPKTIFWQTYILHDESGVVKPTSSKGKYLFRIYNLLLKKTTKMLKT